MAKSRQRRRPQNNKGRAGKVNYLNNHEPVFKSATPVYRRKNRDNGIEVAE